MKSYCNCPACSTNKCCSTCYNVNISKFTNLKLLDNIGNVECKVCGYKFLADPHDLFTRFPLCKYCSSSKPVKYLFELIKTINKGYTLHFFHRFNDFKKYRFDIYIEETNTLVDIMNQHHRYHRFTNDINKFKYVKNNGIKIVYLCKKDALDKGIKVKLQNAFKSKDRFIFINRPYHSEYNTILKVLNEPLTDLKTVNKKTNPCDTSDYNWFFNLVGLKPIVNKPNTTVILPTSIPLDYKNKYGSLQISLPNTTKFECVDCGYTFFAKRSYLMNNLKGCPLCENSHNEKYLYKILKQLDPNVLKEVPVQTRNKMQQRVDFFLPKYNLVVELNDSSHINDYGKTRDKHKLKVIEKSGLNIIYIWFSDIYTPDFITKFTKCIANGTQVCY